MPTLNDALFITNKNVYVPDAAVAASLILSGGNLIIGGAGTAVKTQTAADASRTTPVGLWVAGDLWLSGNCSIGGAGQSCTSYLTVGGDLTLTGGKALAVYAGRAAGLWPWHNGGARVTVAGKTLIDNNSWLLPDCDACSGHPVVLDLNEVEIAADSGIDAAERGWFYVKATPRLPLVPDWHAYNAGYYYLTEALGRGADYGIGAGHGGKGGSASATRKRGIAYGWPQAPLYPGSPNGMYQDNLGNSYRGGGAIRLLANKLTLDGSLIADASNDANVGGPSGGSIWLIIQEAEYGSQAKLSAVGGKCGASYDSEGAGGRVAIAFALQRDALEALARDETPDGVNFEPLTIVENDVSGGRGRLTGTTYYYGNPGTALFTPSTTGPKILNVVSVPIEAGAPTPPYGPNTFAHNTLVTNSAPLYGVAATDSRIRYRCQGYTIADNSGEIASGTTNWVAIPLTQNLTLTWLWDEPQYLLSVAAGENGTLVRNAVAGNIGDWLESGAAFESVTALPAAGYEFLYWLGDVPYGTAADNPLQFVADGKPRTITALFRLADPPAIRTWNGGTSAPGVWHDPDKWLPVGNIPGPEDHVVIASGYCHTTNYANCASLAISNSAILRVGAFTTTGNRAKGVETTDQLVYDLLVCDEVRLDVGGDIVLSQSAQLGIGGPLQPYAAALGAGGNLTLTDSSRMAVYGGATNTLFDFASGTALVKVSGTLRLEAGNRLYPTSEIYTGGSPRFEIGELFVAGGALIDAVARGFGRVIGRDPEVLAPGLGYTYSRGGGYGGYGGSYNAYFGQTYGFAKAPVHPGSCNGSHTLTSTYRGGGLIRLHVAGNATIAGELLSDGHQDSGYGAPSGGGIWLTANRLLFGEGAKLHARGGEKGYSTSGGGGGRIAVGLKLTAADLEALATSGEPLSRVDLLDEAAFESRYQADVDVSAIRGGYPGTFVMLDATQHATILLLR